MILHSKTFIKLYEQSYFLCLIQSNQNIFSFNILSRSPQKQCNKRFYFELKIFKNQTHNSILF